MDFKTKDDLALFFHQLEKDGWIKPEWLMSPKTFIKDGQEITGTRATRVYSINFNNVDAERYT